MPESSGITHALNLLLQSIEVKLFQQFAGASASDAAHTASKVNGALALELLVAVGLIAFFIIVRMTLSVEKPNPAQQIAEMTHEFIGGQAEQVIGHDYERF